MVCRKGNRYETLHKQLADSGDLVFDLSLPVKANKDGRLVLHGPLIQGSSTERVSMLSFRLFVTLTNSKITYLVAYQRTAWPEKQAEGEVS